VNSCTALSFSFAFFAPFCGYNSAALVEAPSRCVSAPLGEFIFLSFPMSLWERTCGRNSVSVEGRPDTACKKRDQVEKLEFAVHFEKILVRGWAGGSWREGRFQLPSRGMMGRHFEALRDPAGVAHRQCFVSDKSATVRFSTEMVRILPWATVNVRA
jgi:hypothetical protein